jgi:transposase
VIEPLLPEDPPKPTGGRPRIDDRAALTGILFVLKSGIPWEMLPQEMGYGSGMACSGVGSTNGTKRVYGSGCIGVSWTA